MKRAFKEFCSVLTAMLMLALSVQTGTAATDDHIVPLRDLQQKLRSNAEQRAQDVADIERVLSYPAAVQELAKYNITPKQVHAAVATLNESELSRLADRARASEQDVQGGLIVGLLALIGLIVVIIIVVSLVAEAAPPPAADTHASTGNDGVKGRAAIAQIAAVHG